MRSTRNGQTIIEAMIAISILIIGFLGTIGLLNRSIGLNRTVSDNYVATYLAAEGIEVTKNLIDGNYLRYDENPFMNGFATCIGFSPCEWELQHDTSWEKPPEEYSGRFLYFDPATQLYSYRSFGERTPFTRKVTTYLNGADELIVLSTVEWGTRGGGRSSVTLEDHFFNWFLPTTTPTSSTSTAP